MNPTYRIPASLLMLSMAVSLAGCGGGDALPPNVSAPTPTPTPTPPPPPPAPSPSPTAQTITFTSPGNQTLGTAAPALAATASSGLAVAITSQTTGVCTVSGTTLTLVAAGTCTLAANQAGDTTYAAAPQQTVSFTVSNGVVAAVTLSTGFASGGLTNEGGAVFGYGGSNLDGFNCNGTPAWCGTGNGGSGATSYFYSYYQTPSAATAVYSGMTVFAPGVTALSASGDTAGGVSVAGLATINFTFNENPEWFQSGTKNFGVILTLAKQYQVGSPASACHVKLLSVVAPLNGGAAAAYAVPLSAFSVIQDCGTGLGTAAAALASAPVVSVDFQGAGGTAALPPVNGLTTGANLTVAAGSPAVYPTTVALTGGISFQPASAPAAQSLVISSGFAANSLTNEGGAVFGYGGSNLDGFNCNGTPAWCGTGSGGSGATSYYYSYYQTPSPATAVYSGMTIFAPGVTALNGSADTAGGVQVTTQTKVNFTLNENPEWFQSGTNNFGVILTLGKLYQVGSPASACHVKLLSVVAPLNGGAAAAYSIPLNSFAVIQDCGAGFATPAAALASSPVVSIDFQGAGGTAALPTVNSLTTGANLTVAAGSPAVYPTTVALTGGVTIEP